MFISTFFTFISIQVHLILRVFKMTDQLLKIKEKLQTKNNSSPSVKKKSTSSILSTETNRCFRYLSTKFCSIIKNHIYQIRNAISIFFKKSKLVQKIICGIFNDSTKTHIVKKEDTKKRANKWIYFIYGTEQKLVHLKKKYDEISNVNEIFFFKNMIQSKKKQRRHKCLCRSENRIENMKTTN